MRIIFYEWRRENSPPHTPYHTREQMIPKTSIKQPRTHTPHMFGSNNVLLLESREQHALHCTSSTAPSLAASLSLLRHVKAPPLLLFLLYWPGFSKQQQFSLHKHSVRVCMCLSVRVFAHHFRTFATVLPRCTAVGGMAICGAIYFTPAFFTHMVTLLSTTAPCPGMITLKTKRRCATIKGERLLRCKCMCFVFSDQMLSRKIVNVHARTRDTLGSSCVAVNQFYT